MRLKKLQQKEKIDSKSSLVTYYMLGVLVGINTPKNVYKKASFLD